MAITFDIEADFAHGRPVVVLFDVQSWYDHPVAVEARAADVLTSEEYSERSGITSVRVRTQRFVSRMVLREACGLVCGIAPQDVRFAYNEHGKPRLDHPARLSPVIEGACHFNLSHTDDLIAFGASTAGPLGIDIERVAARPGIAQIARRFFHPQEFAYATALGQPVCERRFFEVWTRKEALLKALGTGLATDLRRIAVPLPGGEHRYTGVAGAFEVLDVPMPEGYAGAIAYTAPATHDRGVISLQRVTPMLLGAH
jgi:4'-phosphopantetheinyl transferase